MTAPATFYEAIKVGCHASIIIGNANFGNIDNLLPQGRDMEYIARHYNMDLPHLQNVQFSSLSNPWPRPACRPAGRPGLAVLFVESLDVVFRRTV